MNLRLKHETSKVFVPKKLKDVGHVHSTKSWLFIHLSQAKFCLNTFPFPF